MSILTEKEILANMKAYIDNSKEILTNKKLSEEDATNFYTMQITLEGMLELYKKLKTKAPYGKDYMYTSVCPNCGETFQHKRSDAVYCKRCSRKLAYIHWANKLTDEQKEKRRENSKLAMRRKRAKLKEERSKNNE